MQWLIKKFLFSSFFSCPRWVYFSLLISATDYWTIVNWGYIKRPFTENRPLKVLFCYFVYCAQYTNMKNYIYRKPSIFVNSISHWFVLFCSFFLFCSWTFNRTLPLMTKDPLGISTAENEKVGFFLFQQFFVTFPIPVKNLTVKECA